MIFLQSSNQLQIDRPMLFSDLLRNINISSSYLSLDTSYFFNLFIYMLQLRVRMIEARQLQPSNGNPVCRVRCHKQSQQSRVIKSTNSPYWGETIFFNFIVSPAELFEQPIYFEVMFDVRCLVITDDIQFSVLPSCSFTAIVLYS